MKTIVAFIRPSKEESVREALHNAPGVTGATFFDVRGFGRGRGHDHTMGALDEVLVGTLPKVRLEVMVPDEHADAIGKVIAAAAKTGNRGDGKVYVLPVDSALRISTGESGDSAI
ncbi:MAG: P-II family nitrogen regulator [Verrucomicrobiota bacterium]|nr:P-II family nitrogen regulator [Verrucomicrobiota bacterium]